jgi:hypothetical protein
MNITTLIGWRALFTILALIYVVDVGWREHRTNLDHAETISSEIGQLCIEGSVTSNADEIEKCISAEIGWRRKLMKFDMEDVELAVGGRLLACFAGYLILEFARWLAAAVIRAISN